MGRIVARLKVFPEGVEVDLDELTQEVSTSLPEGAAVRAVGREPIAFGLVALLVDVELEDQEGLLDKLEERVSAIPQVSQVSVVGISKASTGL